MFFCAVHWLEILAVSCVKTQWLTKVEKHGVNLVEILPPINNRGVAVNIFVPNR